MQYLFVIVLLFVGMLTYFRVADKYNIIDKPNQRSSHNYITIRGGGIVFWLAAALYCLCASNIPNIPNFQNLECLLSGRLSESYFLAGITLISAVSLWDDISSLPNRVRIVVHFLSISLVFQSLGIFSLFPWWLILIAFILFVGTMNAYNFMDGINGITGLYSLVILIVLQYVNYRIIAFTNPGFINYAILACIVFLFFNYRKRAKCFAGDIGSLGISFWIVTLLLQLMLATESVIWILFLTVYGVDSVCTILHRLSLRQNIFKAHRLHFYQVLSNERGISHLKVSAGYAIIQWVVCGIIVFAYQYDTAREWLYGGIIMAVLALTYLLKFRYLK